MDIKAPVGAQKSVEVFCCYARKDQPFLEELKKHLMALQREGLITLWADTNINAGAEWEKEIHLHLNTSHIILLLISPDFMASKYCYSTEMTQAMKRHESGQAHVIPIILRPVGWQQAPFAKLQALPQDARPIISSKWAYQDEGFADAARGIREAVVAYLAKEERLQKAKEAEQARLAKEAEQIRLAEEAEQMRREEEERLRKAEEERARKAEEAAQRWLSQVALPPLAKASEEASKVEGPLFGITSHYNAYLGLNREAMRLVVSLRLPAQAQTAHSHVALAIVLDCSGSMAGEKIRAARDGAMKVIQELDEQFSFMVVAFSGEARVIYGPAEGIHDHKQKAIQAVQQLKADGGGGRSMSSALEAVIQAFDPYREWARTILFLTDGQNGDQKSVFLQSIEQCVHERISIYAWGMGTNWNANELRTLAEKTHGRADVIPRPEQIEAAFLQTFNQIRQTAFTNVRLVLWTPKEVSVLQVEQAYPTLINLDMQLDSANPRQQMISLGLFATGERRDFLITLKIQPQEPGRPYMILRPSVRFVDAQQADLEERGPRESWVTVEWTLQMALAAKIDERVAHYTREGELADLISQGTDALARGDRQQAAGLFAHALETSEQVKNEEVSRLLRAIVTRDASGQPALDFGSYDEW